MTAPLRAVIVKRPEEAFRSADHIGREWKTLGYTRPPDLRRASEEHRRFVSLLAASGCDVLQLPADDRTGMDSLYTHDPVLITERGAIVFQTGKPARRGEGPAFADALKSWGIPVLGGIEGSATAEAGDMIWLDSETLLVGRGFRTNEPGVQAMRNLLQPLGVNTVAVHLPYADGPDQVLHLMSFMTLLDQNLAVVYRRLLPVPLYELLSERGVELVDIPDEEYLTMGCNVLAVAPREVIMIGGNPITRGRLKDAGCAVAEFAGEEICFPGAGGPTCLTRPLLRG